MITIPKPVVGLALCGLALSACSPADATSTGLERPPDVASHPAMHILERLAAADGVPWLVDTQVEAAARAAAAAGLRVEVVAFDTSTTVTAQYPEPGSQPPSDGVVIVWLGTPPALPEPPPAPEPAPEPVPPPFETATEAAGAERSPAPARPPAGPRSDIRRLPPPEPGTQLEGAASWYGPGFAGRTTACGGVFDPAALTLATRELRCGTRVRITGPSGASVEAVVTDWGPAEWTGRRFDLSHAAFAAIHHPGAGVIPVQVQTL